MSIEKTILFATGNDDKIRDYQIVFDRLGIRLEKPQKKIAVEETTSNLLNNAKLKALTFSKYYPDQIVMASDGGVKIPYLGDNWNHVLTRRLSGLDPSGKFTDVQRAETLLKLMEKATANQDRTIFWEEAITLALNNSIFFEFLHTSSSGILLRDIPQDFNDSGYWIGYLWYDPRFGKTYMQLSEKEKLQSSDIKKQLLKKLRRLDFNHQTPDVRSRPQLCR